MVVGAALVVFGVLGGGCNVVVDTGVVVGTTDVVRGAERDVVGAGVRWVVVAVGERVGSTAPLGSEPFSS